MPTPRKRVKPWLTLSVAQGNAVQAGGLLGAATLSWYAGRRGMDAPMDVKRRVQDRLM